MASGDRYLLQCNATYLGKLHINNFYFKQSGGTAIAADLAAAWDAANTTDLQAILSDEFTFDNLIVINVDNPADFAFQAFPVNTDGGQTSGALPRAVCFTFQYIRSTRASNHGWKRFSGVTESFQEDGVAVSGALTGLATVATNFETPLSAVGSTFTPVIMRVTYSAPPVPVATYTDFGVSSVEYRYLGTQNSRK